MARGTIFTETNGVPVKRFRPGERIDEELFCKHKVHSFCGANSCLQATEVGHSSAKFRFEALATRLETE
jgi:hypothetical protein